MRERVGAQPVERDVLEVLELIRSGPDPVHAQGVGEMLGVDREELNRSAVDACVVARGQNQGGGESFYERLEIGSAGFGDSITPLGFLGGPEERVRGGARSDERGPL